MSTLQQLDSFAYDVRLVRLCTAVAHMTSAGVRPQMIISQIPDDGRNTSSTAGAPAAPPTTPTTRPAQVSGSGDAVQPASAAVQRAAAAAPGPSTHAGASSQAAPGCEACPDTSPMANASAGIVTAARDASQLSFRGDPAHTSPIASPPGRLSEAPCAPKPPTAAGSTHTHANKTPPTLKGAVATAGKPKLKAHGVGDRSSVLTAESQASGGGAVGSGRAAAAGASAAGASAAPVSPRVRHGPGHLPSQSTGSVAADATGVGARRASVAAASTQRAGRRKARRRSTVAPPGLGLQLRADIDA